MRAVGDAGAVGEDPQVVATAAAGVERVGLEDHSDGPGGVARSR